MKRRHFILSGIGLGLGLAYWRYWPEDGFINPCKELPTPSSILNHDLLKAAFSGLQADQVWDCHVHLIGLGDSNTKSNLNVWINPKMKSWANPLLKTQMEFYLNASCISEKPSIDESYVDRLYALSQDFPVGMKFMLLAFDHFYDIKGKIDLDKSAMYTSNDYARRTSQKFSDRFEWICSVHPYRKDAIDELEKAIQGGARAVKWLPASMGIDPASKRCDEFYQTLIKYKIPLLSHAGEEQAVQTHETENYGNPLRLRYPLEKGVKVIIAHCASLGEYPDTDANSEKVTSYKLFARLMAEKQYQENLLADLSGLLQYNRLGEPIEDLLSQKAWQTRLLNASDYPLPGVMPLISLQQLFRLEFINDKEFDFLIKLRRYNQLLFDFVLKRTIQHKQNKFSVSVFHTKHHFVGGELFQCIYLG